MFVALIFVLFNFLLNADCLTFSHDLLPGDPASPGTCPTQQSQDDAMRRINNDISLVVQNTVSSLPQCGEGSWFRVVSFDGSLLHTCPSPWDTGFGACRRQQPSTQGCDSASFSAGGLVYDKVCGKVLGLVFGAPHGFSNGGVGIDGPYVDGVSITTNSSLARTHIWSFAADHRMPEDCPCSLTSDPLAFVGPDYFCDNTQKQTGLLWNGEGCTEIIGIVIPGGPAFPPTGCCMFNSPPYFSTQLPSPTTEGIEVRICDSDSGQDGIDVHVLAFELYIQ